MKALPTPQQLRYLLALAEHRHFGQAAEACAVGQSTLSAGLLALERQLDAKILDRESGRRVLFTGTGLEIVARAREAMAALDAVMQAADSGRAPMSGPLRLGVIPTIGPFLLPRLMPSLRAEFPKLRLSLREDTTERLMARLDAGRIDVALVALPCACGDSETVPVARDPLLLAMPSAHPFANRASVPVTALSGERLLLLEDGHCLRDQALAACGLAQREAREESRGEGGEDFTATSLHMLVQMVAGGLGVTVLPKLAVDAGIAEGADLALRPLGGRGAARTIGLAWRAKSARGREYRALAPLIARAAGHDAEADRPRSHRNAEGPAER